MKMGERRTQIIAVRVTPTVKKRLFEEAQKREKTFTAFFYEIIQAGWNSVKQNNESVKR
jgi:hypothetical protein